MSVMTMPSKALPSGYERKEEWSEITPGERYIIRTSSNVTNGAYSMIEVVADHRNGTPKHVHQNEDEHFIILEGKGHFADGDEGVDLTAGSSLTVRRGAPHAWCNLSEIPLRMLVLFTLGGIDELFRETAKDADLESLVLIEEKFGTRIMGPALFDNIYTRASPRS
jgi:mannose-6-phosphate isomerase-like protein (cupin superfamily)